MTKFFRSFKKNLVYMTERESEKPRYDALFLSVHLQ